MIKYFCDLCGKEMEYFDSVEIEINPRKVVNLGTKREICTECAKKLKTMCFFKPLSIIPQEERNEVMSQLAKELNATVVTADIDEQKPKKRRQGQRGDLDHGKICALFNAGWTMRNIAEEMGCSVSTVNYVIKNKFFTKPAEEGSEDGSKERV